RLFGIVRVAGMDLPVYMIFTKADRLRGFPEFFARLGEAEMGQPFGILTEAAEREERVWAEAESKRLNRHFHKLILGLDDRRRLALSLEPDARRKPAIYEFPREFKKIRNPVVQYLVDVFQPDPLRMGPRLAGLFFTGVLAVEQGQTPEPT